MEPKVSTRRNLDEARVRHLIEAIGTSSVVESSGRATLVVASGIEEPLTLAVGESIDRTLAGPAEWTDSQAIALKSRGPRLEVGLFSDRASYEEYLLREGLAGLTGSLGMTHPVRCVSAVMAAGTTAADLRIVAAHESIHLWVLRTGLCPAWHSWPRWLHEGFAQLWDHAATEHESIQAHSKNSAVGTVRIGPNRSRQRDWSRIAASTDLERFLRRDMIADGRRHSADYATSWAMTYAMTQWGPGTLLAELIHQLQLQDIQPYDGSNPEGRCLVWLKQRLDPDWERFTRAVADLGRV